MNNIKSLRNFGTIYLWIFVIKVLQVCGEVKYHTDIKTDRAADNVPALLMKPYAYQIFDDDYFTDDLLNGRNAIATTLLWRTLNKQQHQQQQPQFYYKPLPLQTTKTKENNGNSMTSKEITFENLNDFNSYKIKNTIWPKKQQLQQQIEKANDNNNEKDIKPQRHSLQQFLVSLGDGTDNNNNNKDRNNKQRNSLTNIRYKQNGISLIRIMMEKYLNKAKATEATKKSNTFFNDVNTTTNERGINEGDVVKENLFPLKDDNTFNVNVNDVDDGDSYEKEERVDVAALADDENGIANSNGNGNESLNYADNNESNTNYMMTQSSDNDHNRDLYGKQEFFYMNLKPSIKWINNRAHKKRAKPSVGHTPFLPAVSGGAMTNLGKFFRDLSKNVHVSEQHQWNAEEQKLLEGDPNFGDIKHHLTKPNAATDQQTAEWIKAIRFYRPSQKIRSLVAMNPHGQWAHSSQFIDPNYMWVGLGK